MGICVFVPESGYHLVPNAEFEDFAAACDGPYSEPVKVSILVGELMGIGHIEDRELFWPRQLRFT